MHLYEMRQQLIDGLGEAVRVIEFNDYINEQQIKNLNPYSGAEGTGSGFRVVLLTNIGNSIPNTLMLSIVPNVGKGCNAKMKRMLESDEIIVAAGSACNTKIAINHVLTAIGADDKIRSGALRISMGDEVTTGDVNKLIIALLKAASQCRK
jgi:cysteine sulfinate desulfinase/cysteine desulfurase-like protein